MWQKRRAELLKGEIEVVLAPLSDSVDLYNLVKEPLTKARRGLAPEMGHDRPWPLLPLVVCESISGSYEHALPAAAALQLLMAAGDVFDDVEDADAPESISARYGPAIAVNAANTLIALAEAAVTRLSTRGVADHTVVRVMEAVNSFFINACAGQHLDLSLSSEIAISEDDYLKVVGMKSASQVECACLVGALLASARQELIDIFAKFGHNLGMAAQITNDIQGITREGDILKPKITLPVIYALAQSDRETRNQLESIFSKRYESVLTPTQVRELLFRIGAVHYATIKMELYKQRALDTLPKAKKAGANVERLKLFLE
jgi:geranylgeranyl pyrophosphate synthase